MSDEVYDRGAVYEDDQGRVIYRASALGRCTGALVRARLGVTGSAPPEVMQERFDEGHEFEARVIAAGLGVDWTLLDARKLGQYGKVVEDHAGDQVELDLTWGDGTRVVRCHPDGIAVSGARFIGGEGGGTAERRVVEAKFFGPDLFYETLSNGLSYPYKMQLSIEMHGSGLPALYIIGKKERAEDGTVSLGEVEVWEIDTPPLPLAEIKMRVLEVEGYVARGEIPPCPVPFDYPCPYWADHDTKEVVEIADETMVKLAEAWEVLDAEAQEIAEAALLLKGQILDRMTELGHTGGRCKGWEVNVITPERGNVSWAQAYKALSKETGKRVDEDSFRGKPGAQHVRMKKVE